MGRQVCQPGGSKIVLTATVQAMIRLKGFPEKYPGLSLEQCGLLFLSTPHSGSFEANWNDVLLESAKVFE